MSSPATSSPASIMSSTEMPRLAQMLLEGEALGRGIADAELAPGSPDRARGRRDSRAPWRRRGTPASPRRTPPPARPRRAGCGGGSPAPRPRAVSFGTARPASAGQPLHRLGEGDAFRLHHEGEDVAVLAGREVVVEALLVVDEERRRALLVEGRQPLPFAPRLLAADALADDLRYRKPGAQLIEKLRRKAHGDVVGSEAGTRK